MTGVESLRLGFAFGLGTATFFAPCALPLLPGYVAFFLGDDGAVGRDVPWRVARAVGISLTTSLGFLAVYGLLAGFTATCGPELIPMLATSARAEALHTSWQSLIRSGTPLPQNAPGTFSNEALE